MGNRVWLEKTVQKPSSLRSQVAARVSHTHHRMMVGDAQDRRCSDALMAYGHNRGLVAGSLSEELGPGACGNHHLLVAVAQDVPGLVPSG